MISLWIKGGDPSSHAIWEMSWGGRGRIRVDWVFYIYVGSRGHIDSMKRAATECYMRL
uniref:Uncharacterized protein n=1 Tax=Picea sitchensis TaxID=3332 RepID=A0A6B9XQJ6_PICSI|nr:hypothetical protein Q903MT_gene3861 [Picea sitchensis]